MKYKILTILLVSLSIACTQKPVYWKLSDFNLKDGALLKNEPVRLLYVHQGFSDDESGPVFTHIVVVSQITGDTVNVLSRQDGEFKNDAGNKEFMFLQEEVAAAYLAERHYDKIPQSKANISLENLKNAYMNRPQIVARDPKFDNLAYNKYPTVFGGVGIITPKGELILP